MPELRIIAMPTEHARAYQNGHADANGHPPERTIAVGQGNPCRHCLTCIKEGDGMLVLAYRPFDDLQPYAEIGPIFLHADECERYSPQAGMPAMFARWDLLIVRGYGTDNRIHYGTADHVPVAEMEGYCKAAFQNNNIAYLHIRTPRFTCYECRIERAI